MSELLSTHDHGNCELCDLLETERAALEAERALDAEIIIEHGAKLEAMERIRQAAQVVVNEELYDWESQGYKSLRELDVALATAQQEQEDE